VCQEKRGFPEGVTHSTQTRGSRRGEGLFSRKAEGGPVFQSLASTNDVAEGYIRVQV